jgi:hypothetical protein
MMTRKKDFEKTRDDYDKKFEELTSNLPDGSTKSKFNNWWSQFKRKTDEFTKNMPD